MPRLCRPTGFHSTPVGTWESLVVPWGCWMIWLYKWVDQIAQVTCQISRYKCKHTGGLRFSNTRKTASESIMWRIMGLVIMTLEKILYLTYIKRNKSWKGLYVYLVQRRDKNTTAKLHLGYLFYNKYSVVTIRKYNFMKIYYVSCLGQNVILPSKIWLVLLFMLHILLFIWKNYSFVDTCFST